VVGRRLIKQLQLYGTKESGSNQFPQYHHVQQRQVAAQTGSSWRHTFFDCTRNETTPLVASRGFYHGVDRADKAGFIGLHVGDYLMLDLPPFTGRVLLGLLHSHEGVGVISLDILTGKSTLNGGQLACKHVEPSSTTSGSIFDMKWPLQMSLHHFVDLRVPMAAVGVCMLLRVRIVGATPSRTTQTGNKIKLLDMLAMHPYHERDRPWDYKGRAWHWR